MAYGARLESGLGASPHEFESRILRQMDKKPPTPSGASLRVGRSSSVHAGLEGHGCHHDKYHQQHVRRDAGDREDAQDLADDVTDLEASRVGERGSPVSNWVDLLQEDDCPGLQAVDSHHHAKRSVTLLT